MSNATNFVCSSCSQSFDWDECVPEEVVAKNGYDIQSQFCYDCVADSIMYDCNLRVPYTITREEYSLRKEGLIHQLRTEREEDFSYRAEDPYDDRDFIYDFDR
jgi:hypothetical protein